MASSVTVFSLISVVFLTIGFVCGYFSRKYKQSTSSRERADEGIRPQQSQPTPVYEEVLPQSIPEVQEQGFELEKNVAYGPE